MAAKAGGRLHQPGANALAQLARGRAGEGHHQNLRRLQGAGLALRGKGIGPAVAQHQAHDQGGNRPGFAGAGAGLYQAAAVQGEGEGGQWVQGFRHDRENFLWMAYT